MSGAEHWRKVDNRLAAWFVAPSHAAGAALVRRVADLLGPTGRMPDVDLRATGVRLILPDGAVAAAAVSAAATDLGLVADPSVLQSLRVAIKARDPSAVRGFWRTVLAYDTEGDDLVDPSRRDAAFVVTRRDDPGALRGRLHVDVARPHALSVATVEALPRVGGVVLRSGEWQAAVADAEGNEVDVVPMSPGDRLDPPGTDDWWALFGAMACYAAPDPSTAAALCTEVATLADAAGVPLLVDLRPDGVTVDTGKDQWEDASFPDLARAVQAAARRLGLAADTTPLRFVQVGIDAVDVAAVREFWRAALRYQDDPREGVTDVFHPHRLTMPVFFQPTDAGDTARRQQRNRLHLELHVPADQAPVRLQEAVAAGGSVVQVDADHGSWLLADPEGNELALVTAPPAR